MVKRRGHTRTNQKGTTFTVREHEMKFGQSTGEYSLKWKHGTAHINGSVTYQTTCPQCKSPVYFYRNDAGSRVFFDMLGKPWPKHGCLYGVRRMQSLAITSAIPVTRGSKQKPRDEDLHSNVVSVDMESLNSGVDAFNKEKGRIAKKKLQELVKKSGK